MKLAVLTGRAGLVAALLLALLGATCGQEPVATGSLRVSVGFADTRTPPAPRTFPAPWAGAPHVRFVGQGPVFDAGAIRVENPTGRDLHVDSIKVTAASRSWSPWPANLVVPAHGALVLTQTASGDFATGAVGTACATPSNTVPTVRVSSGGQAVTLRDQNRVLTSGGRDLAACGAGNASHQWLVVGSVPGAEEVREAAFRDATGALLLTALVLVVAAGLLGLAWSLFGERPLQLPGRRRHTVV